ncbi:40S ribosomal protein S27 [Rhynchospora pubera]|uniref:40S ribosomal protein S27 n=1 Tax=Rhynchospora pubera TaxID=906938 RepID=A0AAV8CL38_9POAL|nr:40S ribosomal protein S27 [Rhynchospora pubera]
MRCSPSFCQNMHEPRVMFFSPFEENGTLVWSDVFFIHVILKCRTTVFSHSQTVVVCANCNTVMCQPTGGKARLTEGCSFRRKAD